MQLQRNASRMSRQPQRSSLTSIVVDAGNKVYDSRENCNAIIETETNLLVKGCNKTIIPKSVTKIASSAFQGCTGLTSVVIPEGVKEIGWDAFKGCTGLTSIKVPAGKGWRFKKLLDDEDLAKLVVEFEP